MRYNQILVHLYYQLIVADEKISEKEVGMGYKMCLLEGISEMEFNSRLNTLKTKDADALYIESSAALKKLTRQEQIRCIAWLCVIGNADGFMDRSEWQFIYRLFHKDLDLRLEEVMGVQKQIMRAMIQAPATPVYRVAV